MTLGKRILTVHLEPGVEGRDPSGHVRAVVLVDVEAVAVLSARPSRVREVLQELLERELDGWLEQANVERALGKLP